MTAVTLNVPEELIPVLDEIGDQLALVLEMGVSRLAPVSTQAYMEAVQFLTNDPDPEAVMAFRFSDAIEQRISALLEQNRQGALSKAEEVELERLVQLEERLQLLKARTRAQRRQG